MKTIVLLGYVQNKFLNPLVFKMSQCKGRKEMEEEGQERERERRGTGGKRERKRKRKRGGGGEEGMHYCFLNSCNSSEIEKERGVWLSS